jgi:protein-disulfide isomerase
MEKQRSTYAIYFLGTVCVLSLSLNLCLLFERNHPDLIATARLAFKQVPPVTETDHVRGDSQASLTAIEYSDFQCPFCKQLHVSLKALADSHKIRWVFRNDPLTSVHPLATKAAIAAECAGQQGRFWDYADALFDDQEQITSQSAFDELARSLNLDSAKFGRCQNSDISALVRDQAQKAAALEIDATPTLFLNGKRYTGALSFEELSQIAAER